MKVLQAQLNIKEESNNVMNFRGRRLCKSLWHQLLRIETYEKIFNNLIEKGYFRE